MKTSWIALIVALGSTALAVAQGPAVPANQFGSAGGTWSSETVNTQAPGGPASASIVALAAGTTIPAELTKSIDAKKAKVGDEVTAKVTQDVFANGATVIRRGSKIVGHVTLAEARTKENAESRLGIVFDHVLAKDGPALTFNSVVQALAAAPEMSGPSPDMGSPMGANRQSPMGTGGVMNGPQSSPMPSSTRMPPSDSGSGSGTPGAAGGPLTSTSQGVIGLRGLSLNPQAPGNAQGSVISSDRENVKLESGTLMIIRATSPPAQ